MTDNFFSGRKGFTFFTNLIFSYELATILSAKPCKYKKNLNLNDVNFEGSALRSQTIIFYLAIQIIQT